MYGRSGTPRLTLQRSCIRVCEEAVRYFSSAVCHHWTNRSASQKTKGSGHPGEAEESSTSPEIPERECCSGPGIARLRRTHAWPGDMLDLGCSRHRDNKLRNSMLDRDA